MSEYLPVVITAYNRPEHLLSTLSSLAEDRLSDKTDVHIFIDGPKAGQEESVERCCEHASREFGFKSTSIYRREKNIGLARNVIGAVTQVIESHQGMIALEDDMLVSRHFLTFMNRAFKHYYSNPFVGCITGYSPPIPEFQLLSRHTFESTRSSTWGWAMKKDDWLAIEWDKEEYRKLLLDESFLNVLNQAGNDRINILRAYVNNNLDIWGIRRASWQIQNNKLTIYPVKSLLKNIGLDGTGSNCVSSNQERNNIDFDFLPDSYCSPADYVADQQAESLLYRFYSR